MPRQPRRQPASPQQAVGGNFNNLGGQASVPAQGQGQPGKPGATPGQLEQDEHGRMVFKPSSKQPFGYGAPELMNSYEEFGGIGLGYDRTTYNFKKIQKKQYGGGRQRASAEESSKKGGEEEEQEDPLARESDMTPKDSTLGKPTMTAGLKDTGTDVDRYEGRRHGLTDVRWGDEASEEIGPVRKSVAGAATYGDRGFRGDALGTGQKALGPANVIDVNSRDVVYRNQNEGVGMFEPTASGPGQPTPPATVSPDYEPEPQYEPPKGGMGLRGPKR